MPLRPLGGLLAALGASGICREPGWAITFEDEFLGTELNASSWTARHNLTHGPTERQLYVRDAVTVEGGALVLTTRKEGAVGPGGRRYGFTSGWVDSQTKRFQAGGRFEVRAKLPSAAVGRAGKWPTAWPAHWLMPEPSTSRPPDVCWPVGGEIDIMEAYHPEAAGRDDVMMTYHWATRCGHDLWRGGQGRLAAPADAWSDEFHTFGVEWAPGRAIDWFVDGAVRYSVRPNASLFVPSDPFYMILNTALFPWANASLDGGLPARHVIDRVTWCEPARGGGVGGARG